jgi:hypothetical protein
MNGETAVLVRLEQEDKHKQLEEKQREMGGEIT